MPPHVRRDTRVFISAVSKELGSARQLVETALRIGDYHVVEQKTFALSYTTIVEKLKERIQSCDAIVHIAGQCFGEEPRNRPQDSRRRSYTQLEYDIAKLLGKPLYLFVTEDGFPVDPHPAELLELQQLQGEHRGEITKGDHEYCCVASTTDLDKLIRSLDLKSKLHQEELEDVNTEVVRASNRILKWLLVLGIAVAILIGGVLLYERRRQRQLADTIDLLAKPNVELIEIHLRNQVDATFEHDIEQASALSDWHQREAARDDAAESRKFRLKQIEQFLKSITKKIDSGESSPEYTELIRIIQEQGIDEALKYVASQRLHLLKQAAEINLERKQEVHHALEPILTSVFLFITQGRMESARQSIEDLLGQDPDWTEALDAKFWLLVESNQGVATGLRTPLDVAEPDLNEAFAIATRISHLEPTNIDWKFDLAVAHDGLGRIAFEKDELNTAAEHFDQAVQIMTPLAESLPPDEDWEGALALDYRFVGHVALEQDQVDKAAIAYEKAMRITERIAARDPSSFEAQSDLALDMGNLGRVHEKHDELEKAAEVYKKALALNEQLLLKQPDNVEVIRHLSLNHEGLARISQARDDLANAVMEYRKCLSFAIRLTELEPDSIQYQRELAISYREVGSASIMTGTPDDAADAFKQCNAILLQLAKRDPKSSLIKRQLERSFDDLGRLAMRQERFEDAQTAYAKSLELAQSTVNNSPDDLDAAYSLGIGHQQIADVELALGHFDKAIEQYTRGKALFEKLSDADYPSDVPWPDAIQYLTARITYCQNSLIATGDFDSLLQHDDNLGELLRIRFVELAKRGDYAEVARAGRAMRELAPRDKRNIYNAACALALAAKLLSASTSALTDQQKADRQILINDSITTLREAIEAGYDNFDHMQNDADLTILFGLPEFEAMAPTPGESSSSDGE